MNRTIDTLGALHLEVERKHDRSAALVRVHAGERQATPDWRFHRHIVRVALYLRERSGLKKGDRVAVVAPLSHEWLIVDWATVAQGATLVVLGPDPTDEALDTAWARFAPRAVFVAGAEARKRVLERGGEAATAGRVVTFDGETTEGGPSFTQLLELGGTLDTAERAGAFRDQARAIDSTSDAIVHVEHEVGDGSVRCEVLTHAEVMARRERFRARYESRRDAIAYVRPDALSSDSHVALYSLVGDGVTTTAIGTASRELDEIARLDPGMVITRSGVVPARVKPRSPGGGRFNRWLERSLGAGFGGSR